jgi:hypothetical protein
MTQVKTHTSFITSKILPLILFIFFSTLVCTNKMQSLSSANASQRSPDEVQGATTDVLALHPTNSHYLIYKKSPVLLVSSAEHYGAVINGNFIYDLYLDTLAAAGLNHTRIWTGPYIEDASSFGIVDNTLAPDVAHFIAPWLRTSTPGALDGGNKFDLNSTNPAFFSRLQDFVQKASDRGIIVEISLFCRYYDNTVWERSPFHPSNNINRLSGINRTNALMIADPQTTAFQKAYVEKIVQALKGFDNIYYELVNEADSGASDDFQRAVISWIQGIEGPKHLLAQSNSDTNPMAVSSAVKILSKHYASASDINALYNSGNVASENETDAHGSSSDRRHEAWRNVMSGAALYSHLDLTYRTGGSEAGSDISGLSGGPTLRSQLHILRSYVESFDFPSMSPSSVVTGISSPLAAYALGQDGVGYIIYIDGGSSANIDLNLPSGSYTADWLNNKTGNIDKSESFSHSGGVRSLASPGYNGDIVLGIRSVGRPHLY